MNEKQTRAEEYLDKVDRRLLTYSEAREALISEGYSDDEIAEYVSNHSTDRPKHYIGKATDAPDEATVAIAKAKLGFVTQRALRDEQLTSAAAGIIVPNKYAKIYFFNKFLKNYSDAKSLEQNGKLDPDTNDSLFKKYRIVRYNTILGLIGLVLVTIFAGQSLIQLVTQLFFSAGSNLITTAVLSLGLISWVLAFTSPLMFYFVKKEAVLKAYIVFACVIPGVIGIVLGIVVQNYFISALALFGILFALWQSSRVGVLSVLGRK